MLEKKLKKKIQYLHQVKKKRKKEKEKESKIIEEKELIPYF